MKEATLPIRIATFNVENLFARYNFREGLDPTGAGGFTVNQLAFDIYNDDEKRITAHAIREVGADIICLQEVDNLPLLDRFNSYYLAALRYRFRVLIDSHDPRQIDVAVMSRYPFAHIRTHRDERRGNAWLFSRDCLEVQADIEGKPLFLYVNHFKSMIGGRAATKRRRKDQAGRVAELITERWSPGGYQGDYVVLGDLNDYPEGDTSLGTLLTHEGLVNPMLRLPEGERWTHYFAGGNEYRQLDHIFLSPGLANRGAEVPGIMRQGLPHRAERYTGNRFPEVGENEPKASDHAPVFMDIELA
jgi:endonuclease/exonuclease/phosphatase family metal-dependent hydrolase